MTIGSDRGTAPRRPWPGGGRGAVLLGLAAVGVWCAFSLDLSLADALPGAGGLEVAREFFARAFSPAFASESGAGVGTPILGKALEAAGTTILFAAAALGLSLLVGLPLALLASSVWWVGDPAGGRGGVRRLVRRQLRPGIYVGSRVVATLMRSVHELLWAVLFLAALGITNLAAVIAIAIPYAGILAKVFSEMLDEAPRSAAHALRAAGATPLQQFLFGVLPRALPDMIAYGCYRFECALRSAAILGFFGYPTLGYYLAISFENLHYGEVWTYLYTLFALVLAVDLWSGALRRRLV